MKQIKSESELIGKTITKIGYVNLGKRMVLFFGDEYAVYNSVPGWESGDEEIEFDADELGIYQKKKLGLVTTEEYESEKNRRQQANKEYQEKKEREQYERLHRKYG